MACPSSSTRPPASAGNGPRGPVPRARGFTLLESMIAATLLAIATVAVVGPVLAARQHAQSSEIRLSAQSLARQLLDEIMCRPYADPDDGNTVSGPETGETRSTLDNIDDYDGLTETVVRNGMTFTRTVSVHYRNSPNGPRVAVGDFALVTVTVGCPAAQPVTLRYLATRGTILR